MKKYLGAIFDLDGVIVDTAKYHYLAWKQIADEMNFEFTKEDNERLKGVSRIRSLEILLEVGDVKNLSEEKKELLAEKKNNIYVNYLNTLDDSELLPNVKETILDLRKKGIKIALGSASKNSLMILKKLNITNLFDAIIDGNQVSVAKPDPEVFKLGANELSLEYSDCVVFEDSQAGLDAAKSINCYTVAVGKRSNLIGGDIYINDFQEFDANSIF